MPSVFFSLTKRKRRLYYYYTNNVRRSNKAGEVTGGVIVDWCQLTTINGTKPYYISCHSYHVLIMILRVHDPSGKWFVRVYFAGLSACHKKIVWCCCFYLLPWHFKCLFDWKLTLSFDLLPLSPNHRELKTCNLLTNFILCSSASSCWE